MFKTMNFAARALLGAAFPLLASHSFALAQTVPVQLSYTAPVSTYNVVSPYPVAPAYTNTLTTSAYGTPLYGYTAVAPSVAPIPPCLVLSDYDQYLAQLYGYQAYAAAGCQAGTTTTGYVAAQPRAYAAAPVIQYEQHSVGQNQRIVGAPTVPLRKFATQPVVVTTQQTTTEQATPTKTAIEQAVAASSNEANQTADGQQAVEDGTTAQSRFRFSTNVALQLGYEARYDIQPAATQLDYDGFASLVIDRRDGTYTAQTQVDDPNSTLSNAYLNAQAPSSGNFIAQAALEDQYGNSLDVYLDSDGGEVPTTVVRSDSSLVLDGTATATGEYVADAWSAGATVGVDFSSLNNLEAPTLSTASAYVSSKYGTISAGYGLGLPYSPRSYEVISGGSYSFADFGDYQASYVSPVIANTRVSVLGGLQTRQFAGTAEYQITRGNNQVRAAAYGDTAYSVQGELGYTRALGNQRFVGASVYAGRDGSGESFYGLQGNVDLGRHSLQANATRVRSDNLTILYGSEVTGEAVLGIEINDHDSFNQQTQLNLEYSFQATDNLQLYANAEWINHKYYGSAQAVGGGIRASF